MRRLITPYEEDHAARTFDGAPFRMSATTSEPKGYLSVTQTADGVIQLISTWNAYSFNLAWLEAEPPSAPPGPKARPLAARETLARAFDGA